MSLSYEQLQETNSRLKERISELTAILDIAKTLSSLSDLEELCPVVINVATTVIRAEHASLLSWLFSSRACSRGK